ncbi:hypothetical protein ACIP2Y_18150 [Streptomyces sviceus]|uniref:hypothetical protein n=1 Tax=Streptomyces sviceus TaxID=285530 RepID=UPI00380F9608
MGKWRYTAEDQNRNALAKGTVDAEGYGRAVEAASKDARSNDVPFYRLTVGEKEED